MKVLSLGRYLLQVPSVTGGGVCGGALSPLANTPCAMAGGGVTLASTSDGSATLQVSV